MKKSAGKAVAVIIIASVFLIMFAFCGHILSKFTYSDHLDEKVITVDDKDITLREFGYYIYEVEAFVQNHALLYDPENPGLWWNTHFSAGMDSQFVCDYAKKVAINMCIADEIYYRQALSQGLSLTSNEEAQVLDDVSNLINNMDSRQLLSTGLDEKIIFDISKKHALASKCAEKLVKDRNLAAYYEEPAREVNWDGAYFQEQILPGHTIRMNDSVLDKITFGKITVNLL